MSRAKRFIPIAEYQRQTGLSYQTVKHALDTGELRGVRTESGHWKIDTHADGNSDLSALIDRLDNQERLLSSLCAHLGVKVG